LAIRPIPAPQSITLFLVCSGCALKYEKINLNEAEISGGLRFANPPRTPLYVA
jgi:hypothetical protein